VSEQRFTTARNWPRSPRLGPVPRLVEIWNGVPGATPVKKLTDCNKGVARVWKSIQSLAPSQDPIRLNRPRPW
jgi:hypothetical protein